MKNFWVDLPKPFTVLAPLDGVTDVVFRQIVTELGKPDVLFTEFTSCDGLQSVGSEKVAQNLKFYPNEQPIVAQIWGANPENFYKTAKLIKELGFVGVDINMGCPARAVIEHGVCSALINNPRLAGDIIQATKDGADGLPVSVKTRIGFGKESIEDWIGFLLRQKIATLTVHLRTVEELSKVPAHWELMPQIMTLRNALAPETLIIGNGDIVSLQEVQEKFDLYGCDGFMIGRGIFANPWVFNPSKKEATREDRIETFVKHIDLYGKTWGAERNFAPLKKFCKTYINNFEGAARCREKLMEAETLEELRNGVADLNDMVEA